jgi:hypothetical protein
MGCFPLGHQLNLPWLTSIVCLLESRILEFVLRLARLRALVNSKPEMKSLRALQVAQVSPLHREVMLVHGSTSRFVWSTRAQKSQQSG